MTNLHIGTSGWAYKEWKPDFYPADLPQRAWLEHYCRALGACEINATFYRQQSLETFAKWADSSPPGFRFATKAHRRLTHSRGWELDEARLIFQDTFLKSVTALGDRLGVVLWQFPTHKGRDEVGLTDLLDALPGDLCHAFEFRDESWDRDDVRTLVGERGGTVCVSNTDGTVPASLPPGPLAYVRLRTERYSPEARSEWLDLLLHEAQERPVYVFAKHEGIPTADQFGGVGLARWLTERARELP